MTPASLSITKHNFVWFLAILFGLVVCTTSLAQPNPFAPSLAPAPVVLVKGKEGKGVGGEKGKKDEDKDEGKGNKQPGKLRGLDRADEVAGEHGKQGRDNARTKQGR